MKNIAYYFYKKNHILRTQVRITLFFILFLSQNIIASPTTPPALIASQTDTEEHGVHLIYTPNSNSQRKIEKIITAHLVDKKIQVQKISPIDLETNNQTKPTMIIAIGIENIKYAANNFKNTDTLAIVSNPTEYHLNKKSNNNAVLYMSQPYCKQIHFIYEINQNWKTISYLNDKDSAVDDNLIKKCAETHHMTIHKVDVKNNSNLSLDVRDALTNSDLLLALPNNKIYNRKSVKNILLTSYRVRKPVFGFSKNFVTSGALASMHSSLEHIALSANDIVDQYYSHNKTFTKKINYPKAYDISFNRQVFRALNLQAPSIEKIKQTINITTTKNSGKSQ